MGATLANAGSRSLSPPITGRDKSINFRVQALASSLFKGAQQFYGTWVGLTVPEMRIIAGLDSEGPLNASQLAHYTAMDKALVSRILRALRERGLIAAISGARSRRCSWELSPSGRRLVLKMRPVWLRRETLLQEGLNEAERAGVKLLLDLLFQSSERLRLKESAMLKSGSAGSRLESTSGLMKAHLSWVSRNVRKRS